MASTNGPKLCSVTISKKQLTAAILGTLDIDERERFAAFLGDEATRFAPNPFAVTSVGVVVQTWSSRRIEFTAFGVVEAGLAGLVSCARGRCPTEPLVQEILKAGPHTLYLFHHGDGCRILGSVLHGKPGVALPAVTPRRQPRRRSSPSHGAQLNLFAAAAAW